MSTRRFGHRLPLPLLVLGIGADDHHGAVATDDLAVVAARLDGSSDFQRIFIRVIASELVIGVDT